MGKAKEPPPLLAIVQNDDPAVVELMADLHPITTWKCVLGQPRAELRENRRNWQRLLGDICRHEPPSELPPVELKIGKHKLRMSVLGTTDLVVNGKQVLRIIAAFASGGMDHTFEFELTSQLVGTTAYVRRSSSQATGEFLRRPTGWVEPAERKIVRPAA